ncbi:MAG: transposase [Nitrospirae bacterium]|nr:transposase [Nitrospirota bacterium]
MNMIITQDQTIKNSMDLFCKEHQIGQIMKMANIKKNNGIAPLFLFKYIFQLAFMGKNLYRLLQGKDLLGEGTEKDTVYRFLNSPSYNWRKFLLHLSSAILDSVELLTSRDKVLIFDDSLYSRNRSKKVELLARVYDHVERRFCKGFRMLTLGWSDGATFLPVSFSLLSSEEEKNRICGVNAGIDKRTNGYKRRSEGIRKATDVLFELLQQAKSYGISARYVLFDSWFSFPVVIQRVLQSGFNVICMLKKMPHVRYLYEGRHLNLEELYKAARKKCGRAKILASAFVSFGESQQIKGRIFFVRDRNSRNWLAIFSSDVTINGEEVVRIYGKRWDIEVFFKMCKSHLQLAKEFQGRSYDAMVAHTTIVFCRYIMLAMEERNNEDDRTFGNLFYLYCDEIRDIQFSTAIQLLLKMLVEHLRKNQISTDDAIHTLLSNFISALPPYYKGKLAISICES